MLEYMMASILLYCIVASLYYYEHNRLEEFIENEVENEIRRFHNKYENSNFNNVNRAVNTQHKNIHLISDSEIRINVIDADLEWDSSIKIKIKNCVSKYFVLGQKFSKIVVNMDEKYDIVFVSGFITAIMDDCIFIQCDKYEYIFEELKND